MNYRNQSRYIRRAPKIYGNMQKSPRSFRWFINLIRQVLWLGVIGLSVYLVWFSGWFNLRKVEIEGARFSSSSAIESLTPKGQNIWLVSKDELASRIAVDQVVSSVAVLRGLPDSLKIVVKEKQPALIWISGETATVLDDQGIGFVQYSRAGIPTEDTEVGRILAAVPRVYDTKPLDVKLGSQVASPTFIRFVNSLNKELTVYTPEIKVDHLEISDTTYDLILIAKQGLKVQFNTLGEAAPAVRNLSRLLRDKKATLSSRVDLRIDRWAYIQ